MKVQLTIDLDLPDGCNDYTDGELEQLLADEYINHCEQAHAEAATKWCAKAKVGAEDGTEDGTEKK